MDWTTFSSLAMGLNDAQVALWGSVASIVSLVLVALSYRKIGKISHHIVNDRDTITEIIRPFDTYIHTCNAVKLLQQNEPSLSRCEAESRQLAQILTALSSSTEYLRSYFWYTYGLRTVRENAYLDAGRIFTLKCHPKIALDFYEKAHGLAEQRAVQAELEESFAGKHLCHALLYEYEKMTLVEAEAKQKRINLRPSGAIQKKIPKNVKNFPNGVIRLSTMLGSRPKTFVKRLAKRDRYSGPRE